MYVNGIEYRATVDQLREIRDGIEAFRRDLSASISALATQRISSTTYEWFSFCERMHRQGRLRHFWRCRDHRAGCDRP